MFTGCQLSLSHSQTGTCLYNLLALAPPGATETSQSISKVLRGWVKRGCRHLLQNTGSSLCRTEHAHESLAQTCSNTDVATLWYYSLSNLWQVPEYISLQIVPKIHLTNFIVWVWVGKSAGLAHVGSIPAAWWNHFLGILTSRRLRRSIAMSYTGPFRGANFVFVLLYRQTN